MQDGNEYSGRDMGALSWFEEPDDAVGNFILLKGVPFY